MKFSLNWLKEKVSIDCSPQVLMDRLTMAGFEGEGIETIGDELQGVVTGKIVSIDPHPNADRLVITKIDTGGETTHQIVTGANNISVGDIVPVSLPGAVLKGGMKIKVSKLRDVESSGMLCSEKELGVSEESQGIWILEPDTPIGEDFIQYAGLKDTVLDISVLPNRGDCLSIQGLTRELGVILGHTESVSDSNESQDISSEKSVGTVSVSIAAKQACSMYTARVIDGVTNGPSPLWLQRKLQAMGIRPIDRLVDITNYVLLETGQPLHVFDASKLDGGLEARLAKESEPIVTLDGEERVLNTETLVITDESGPVAVAGIMGGERTAVDSETTCVVLEAAFFDPITVRRGQRVVGLRSESAIRFEKGVDWEGVKKASDRAAALIIELCGGKCGDRVDVEGELPNVADSKKVSFSIAELEGILGMTLSDDQVRKPLALLGFTLNDSMTEVDVPSWRRADVHECPDLAEEVMRLTDLSDIPSTMPEIQITQKPESRGDALERGLLDAAVANGLSQVVTFPMISPTDLEKCQVSADGLLRLSNPLSQEESVMRPSGVISLLKVADYNLKRQLPSVALIELGSVFPAGSSEGRSVFGLHSAVSFSSFKGTVERLVSGFKLGEMTVVSRELPYLHPKQSGVVQVGGQEIGVIGTLHPLVAKAYDLPLETKVFELNLKTIAAMSIGVASFKLISKFPSTRRDITILAPKSIEYGEVDAFLKQYRPKYCVGHSLLDHYESESLGADKRSLTLAMTYQHQDRTLEVEEVNKIQAKFTAFIQQKLPVTV